MSKCGIAVSFGKAQLPMKLYTMAAVTENSSRNVLISPFGIGELLTLALIKSDGKTREQIAKVRNFEWKFTKLLKGSSINDVTVFGGGGQGFCDGSTKALVIKSVTMGEGAGGQKLSKIA